MAQPNQQQPATTAAATVAASSSASSITSIPQTLPAGGLTITQPPQTATSYYKLQQGNIITFAWNFTSIFVTPTHLTVSAICDNGNTYPVGPTDGVIPGTATSVTWDIYSYNQAHPTLPLAVATYRLNIWDDRGPGAPIEPGHFQENNALQFAIYTPLAYTPLDSGWQCVGCRVNEGFSTYATHPVTISLITTFMVMFLSGFAILRQAFHH